jgi:hypothetical protein
VGGDSHLEFCQKLLDEDGCLRWGCCHGEAARSVFVGVRGDVLACFHAVTAKPRSRTQNSQFSLLEPVLRAITTAV